MNSADVLIVGAGPAGSVAALQLARAGRKVLAIDRRAERDASPPAVNTAGGATHPSRLAAASTHGNMGALLTPRALHALERCGIRSDSLPGAHRIDKVRLTFADDTEVSSSVSWPADVTRDGTGLDRSGLVVDRAILDRTLADAATAAGATIRFGAAAIEPIVERGFVRGANIAEGTTVDEQRAEFTVIADGANSRFGRALGTYRTRSWPFAVAHRGRYESPLSDVHEAEFLIGIRDAGGYPVVGHAWMFPCGDGTVVVGVMVMSTSTSFPVIKPENLLESVVETHRQRWQLRPLAAEPTFGSRLPLGTSVRPIAGPTYLLIGDAAGAANPFTGAGLEYAIETGDIAASVLNTAFDTDSAANLQRYPALVQQNYGEYFKLGRLSSRILGSSTLVPRLARFTAQRSWAADTFLRISSNELRSSGFGLAELIVKMGRIASVVAPAA